MSQQLTFLILNSVLLGVVLIIMILIMVLLVLRQHYQPLKKRSPKLIMLSCVGNFLFCLCLLLEEIQFNDCRINSDSEVCNSPAFAGINCFLGFILLSFCEPMAVIPYILRSIRLYVIFKAQEYYFRERRKPTEWFNWIKEQRMIKICFVWVAILTVISIMLYILYLFNKDAFLYAPSYTVSACYMKSLGEHIDDPLVMDKISVHTNISLTFLIIMHAVECVLFIVCIHQLRNIKDDFNIKNELCLVFTVWLTGSQASIAVFLYASPHNTWEYYSLILVFRSLIACLVTTVKPIYQTYQGNQFILLPPSQENIESLDIVLHIPIASEYFFDYLDYQSGDPAAPILFSLYADLRDYDKACSEQASQLVKYEKAIQIQGDYLSVNGKFCVEIDEYVKRVIANKFTNLQENLNEYLFIELYAYVLDKLREHFDNFKGSVQFVELEDQISKQEKLYEVLVDASIITN